MQHPYHGQHTISIPLNTCPGREALKNHAYWLTKFTTLRVRFKKKSYPLIYVDDGSKEDTVQNDRAAEKRSTKTHLFEDFFFFRLYLSENEVVSQVSDNRWLEMLLHFRWVGRQTTGKM